MDYRYTEADHEYKLISEAMSFVRNTETAIEMIGCIREYSKRYPSYNKTTLLKSKFINQFDKLEKLDPSLV